jgi:hypothetical protein
MGHSVVRTVLCHIPPSPPDDDLRSHLRRQGAGRLEGPAGAKGGVHDMFNHVYHVPLSLLNDMNVLCLVAITQVSQVWDSPVISSDLGGLCSASQMIESVALFAALGSFSAYTRLEELQTRAAVGETCYAQASCHH